MGIRKAAEMPIGTRLKWPSTAKLPKGCVKENGAAISRTAYAKLFALIGTTYGAGDGVTTFNVPDTRGYFERNLDDGRGVDSGRGLGTAQTDDLKSHAHTFNTGGGGGSFGGYPSWGNGTFVGAAATVAAGGAETRPKNYAFLSIIKAY